MTIIYYYNNYIKNVIKLRIGVYTKCRQILINDTNNVLINRYQLHNIC